MEYLGIADYARILWRRRWLILLAGAVAAGAAYGISNQRTRWYAARATLFVGPRAGLSLPAPAENPGALGELTFSPEFVVAYAELLFSRDLLTSYADLLRSRFLAERVAQKHDLGLDAGAIAARIATEVRDQSRVIEVRVTDTSPDRAARIGNAVVEVFVSDVQEEFGGLAARATAVDRAVPSGAVVRPKPRRDGALGGILGLMVGMAGAVLIAQLDTRLRRREDVEAILAPVLAVVPAASPRIHVRDDPESPASEAFRLLRTGVQFLGVERSIRTVLVTSPEAGAGGSTVAANLAAAMAEAGRRTLLVDADLRDPHAHELFGVPASPGLTDAILGGGDLAGAVRPTGIANLAVLPAGTPPPNPSEILAGARMAALVESARATADVVILDAPAALPVTDALVLAPHADGVIVVVRAGRTPRDAARETVAAFERLGARVLGAVLTDARGR